MTHNADRQNADAALRSLIPTLRAGGGEPRDGVAPVITQTAHGFSAGMPVALVGGTWVRAAISTDLRGGAGVVLRSLGTNLFQVLLAGSGMLDSAAFTAGSVYGLGDTAGTAVTGSVRALFFAEAGSRICMLHQSGDPVIPDPTLWATCSFSFDGTTDTSRAWIWTPEPTELDPTAGHWGSWPLDWAGSVAPRIHGGTAKIIATGTQRGGENLYQAYEWANGGDADLNHQVIELEVVTVAGGVPTQWYARCDNGQYLGSHHDSTEASQAFLVTGTTEAVLVPVLITAPNDQRAWSVGDRIRSLGRLRTGWYVAAPSMCDLRNVAATAPTDGQFLKWVASTKRWTPSDADIPEGTAVGGSTDGGIVTSNDAGSTWDSDPKTGTVLVSVYFLEQGEMWYGGSTERGDGYEGLALLAPAAEGYVMGFDFANLRPMWTQDPIIGTAAAGGGTFKVYWAAGKYVGVDDAGTVTIYVDSTHKVEIDDDCKVTITYPDSNKVEINLADFGSYTGKTVKLRADDVCEDGTWKKALYLRSETFTP
jgi:hypothetical protein